MSIEKKKHRVEFLRRQLEEATEELERDQRVLDQEPGPGSKVIITAIYPGSSKKYEFLALRPAENTRDGGMSWYVTGRAGSHTWTDILNRIQRADYTVNVMKFIEI